MAQPAYELAIVLEKEHRTHEICKQHHTVHQAASQSKPSCVLH